MEQMDDYDERIGVTLQLCGICHCKLYLRDFYRFNSKNRVKRFYKVCNQCIIKSRIRQSKLKDIDQDKKKYDEMVKRMSHAVYIEDGDER